jgi:hypothetical protein
MTGRNLISRLTWLGCFLLCAGALHLASTLGNKDIARLFIRSYVPLAKEEATRRAIELCDRDSMSWSWQSRKNCSLPSDSDVAMELRKHEQDYEYSIARSAETNVRDGTNFAFGSVYAILFIAGLWGLIRWFAANIWPKIAGFAGTLHRSINWTEMGATRRLRRAEDEFRTLKNLRDQGLIAEDVFVARKDKLRAAIRTDQGK